MLTKPTVLLVDDLEENLVALEALLRSEDISVLKALSGREALELLLTHEVALALLDVHMPEMDGFELAELMLGSERTRGVPIIFVTAGGRDPRRVFKGYEAGAIDFLFKPLDPLILQNKVAAFIQLYRQKQQLADQLRELKRAEEELRELDRRKNDFIAVLSHELRNPLAPIRNSLYILDRAPVGSERAVRAKAVIDRQVEHLARLVDDLLDVTRVTRGKIELHRERVDLVQLTRRCVDDHRGDYETVGVALVCERVPGAPLMIDADPVRIAQALGNLLTNAAKFTPSGGRVEVSLERRGANAWLSVRDTGVGLAREMFGRIFEPFAQGDRSLDRSRGGLGLGLAVVKGIVELHGGMVTVASGGANQGAEFTMTLPVVEVAADAENPPAAALAAIVENLQHHSR